MSNGPSLMGRALIAIALMVGFYVLALAVAGGLLYIPYAEWKYADRIHLKIALACIVGAGVILWSILPRFDRFQPPGPELSAGSQQRLFQALEEIARSTGQAMPVNVYLTSEMNAWVSQRGGVMGFGSHRVMGLGLPLMETLTIPQFRAVLAHEFGHYHGGDTQLGPWIYKTRSAIGRTLQNLSEHRSWLLFLFDWYGDMFLRITQAISRQQEFAADALASRVVGARPLMDGLRAIHGAGGTESGYWSAEVQPVLNAGFRPPLAEGFRKFIASPSLVPAVTKQLEQEMEKETTDPFDTHPPLKARLQALETMPPGDSVSDARPATALLDRIEATEQSLVEFALGPEKAASLAAISWNDVPARVLVPAWKQSVAAQQKVLAGKRIADVPELVTRLRLLMDSAHSALEVAFQRQQESEEGTFKLTDGMAAMLESGDGAQQGLSAVGAALTLILIRSGLPLHADPGELYLVRDDLRFEPFNEINQLSSKQLVPDAWLEKYKRLGLADADLSSVVESQASAS